MPLTSSLSNNIRELIKSGKPKNQAVAIALEHKKKSKKKKGMGHVRLALKKLNESSS